jgi:prepilin-type N-terminal cleavage/methylation domain-containing protein
MIPQAPQRTRFRLLTRKSLRSRERGFSIIELIIVCAIICCVSVIATPSMLQIVANVRTRSTMNNLSGIIQRCRSEAVRKNATWTVHFAISAGDVQVFDKDVNAGSTMASGDPGTVLGNGVVMYRTLPSGGDVPTAFTASSLWGSSDTAPAPSSEDVSFNSRGMPCYYSAGTCLNKGFVYYFTYNPPFGSNGWAAMSVSPAGRVKAWIWDGHAWKN